MTSRVVQYLDEVSRPLPASERLDWRAEAEQHLAALSSAYEEMGYPAEAAAEMAIEKFGEAGGSARRCAWKSKRGRFPCR